MKTQTWRTDKRFDELVRKSGNHRMIRQHICCQNDVNGNPRRLYAVYNVTGKTVAVIEEGYSNISDDVSQLSSIMEIVVAPTEYNAIKKQAQKDGIYISN